MKRILPVFSACCIFLLLTSRTPTSGSPVPVLTTTAGSGISAQISDYTLNGNQFCFTITNTSTTVPINAIGFDLGAGVVASSLTQTGAGSFFVLNSPGTLGGVNPLSFALIAVTGETKVETLANRIQPGMSTTFCVTANYSGFSALQIAQSLVVVFGADLTVGGFQCQESFEETDDIQEIDASINIIFASESQFCFTVSNSETSEDAITGVGFAATADGLFTLESIDPLPQPGRQNLTFTTDPGPVPQFHNIQFVPGLAPEFSNNLLDFALVTSNVFAGGNPQKGIQPGETSSEFCVNGSFSLDLPVSTNFVFVRYPGKVLTCRGAVIASVGGGLIGSRPA
jgi:hypothetical protein